MQLVIVSFMETTPAAAWRDFMTIILPLKRAQHATTHAFLAGPLISFVLTVIPLK